MASADPNGVACLYSNNGNFLSFGGASNGGHRWNCMSPPLNCEFTGYFQTSGSDDVAAKGRGGRHSDGVNCDGCCYVPACPTGGGSSRYRCECPHPDTPGASGDTKENSCASSSSWKGFKWIVWNTANNCVHWEFWQDQGNNSSTPANQWVRISHATDCNGHGALGNNCGGGPLLRPRGSSNQFTWRIDSSVSGKWLSAVELVAGNSAPTQPGPSPSPGGPGNPPPATPGTGGGGSPGGIPGGGGAPVPPGGGTPGTGGGGEPGFQGDGGGGGGNDNNTGTGGGGGASAQAFASRGCAIAIAGNTRAQAGQCTGTGGGTGEDDLPLVPGDVGVGGSTEPKPVVTVYKDLALLYNIRTDLFDNCTISGDPNVSNYEEIYSVSPIAGEYLNVFQNSTTALVGLKLHSSQSSLHKKVIRKVDITMKRSTNEALTGIVYVRIRDRNGVIMHTFDTEMDPAVVELNDTTYSFLSTDNTYKMQAGDMILLEYTNGGDTANHLLIAHAPGQDSVDGFNTVYVESQSGISYDVDQLADAAFKLYI